VVVAFTACVADAKPLFKDAKVVTAFVELLRVSSERHGYVVVIHCFMPDHIHLLLRGTTAAADAWQAMVEFKQRTGFWLRQYRPDIAWQKDFSDHVIRADEDLGAQVRYIAGNPVRKGLVKDWRGYPHTGSIGVDLEAVINGILTL
jgi:REP element-mobilizing transposase RayT